MMENKNASWQIEICDIMPKNVLRIIPKKPFFLLPTAVIDSGWDLYR